MWLAVAGCKSEETEHRAQQRRQLLLGQDLDKARDDRFNKTRLMDEQGNLLPSETEVASVLLPRGFTAKFTYEYEWYYDGPLPLDKLEKYFRERVAVDSVQNTPEGLLFAVKQPKDKPGLVALTIYATPGRSDWSRIHIRQPPPTPLRAMTPAEIEARFAKRTRY